MSARERPTFLCGDRYGAPDDCLCGVDSGGLCHEGGQRFELHVCALTAHDGAHDGAHECGCGHRWTEPDDD